MGFSFPSGFPSPAEGWNKGGREERRLMWRKRRCVREKVGWWIWGSRLSFCLGKKRGCLRTFAIMGPVPESPMMLVSPCLGRFPVRTCHRPRLPSDPSNNCTHLSFCSSWEISGRGTHPRLLFWVSHQQRKLQGDALTCAWAVPATFHSSGLKSLLFFYKSLVQA